MARISSGELLNVTTVASLPMAILNISAARFCVLPAEIAPKLSLPGWARSNATSWATDPRSPPRVASSTSNFASAATGVKSLTTSKGSDLNNDAPSA